ncbi:hypothetical protein [Streptomyces sp. RKAG337]|uniref:hypothetical protein n=1 Tax=Streptomyces sp. RKAG337 TaxID=2893404 RepID=UPI00203476F2|nr:hypothetical protein [Streptomyces sp. RKAG337]MCM2427250.1 hypothetical protein [Streptomyces sp. RKAG337]
MKRTAGNMKRTLMASEHRWIYIGSIVLLVVFAVIGIIQYTTLRETVKANDKANQLSKLLTDAGYPVPDHDLIVRTLGDDGASLCRDPGNSLIKAQAKAALVNGASGPGTRPVIADSEAISAASLAVSVYCPDKLGDFEKAYGGLKYDDTVKK